jgi:hypothetical protein
MWILCLGNFGKPQSEAFFWESPPLAMGNRPALAVPVHRKMKDASNAAVHQPLRAGINGRPILFAVFREENCE